VPTSARDDLIAGFGQEYMDKNGMLYTSSNKINSLMMKWLGLPLSLCEYRRHMAIKKLNQSKNRAKWRTMINTNTDTPSAFP